MAGRYGSILFASVCVAAVVVPAQAFAQSRHWEIAAGDLKRALDAYARQSGRQVIYKVDEVRGVRSPGAAGNLDADAALSAILAGTGFSARTDTSGAIAVVRNAPQTADAEEAPAEGPDQDIVVTGTNIHGQEPVGSQVIVIDRKAIERNGHSTALEIVRAMPQNFAGGVSNDTGVLPAGAGLGDTASSTNANGGTAFNLRGAGAGATLTLVNGRRLAPSGIAGAYADVSNLPISAIERVEVLPDGASALYGSDAIGGVVNFVLRKDFDGAESRASFGTVTKGGLTELVLGQTLGKRWSTGGLLVTAEHYRQAPLEAIDRPAFNLDFRRYGGADRRTMTCTPGTLQVGGQNFALNGTATPTAGQNLCSPDDIWIYPRVRRTNVVALADQEIGSIFKIEADASWSRTINERDLSPFSNSVAIYSFNPYYLNPLGNGAPVTVQVDTNDIVGPTLQRITTDSFGGGLSLIAKPGANWSITAAISYGQEKVHQWTGYVDPISLATAGASATTATAFNPFSTPAGNSQAILDYLKNSLINLYDLKGEQWIYRLSADGPLFALPGGDIRVALGVERREIKLAGAGSSNFVHYAAYSSTFGSAYDRTINAAFAELVVPIFGASNARPGLRRLELGFAVRGEDYSDFGQVVVPRAGISWVPVDGLKLRGSASRSYRAPSPTDLAGQQNSFLYQVADPLSPTMRSNVMILNGGNDQLKEEHARTLSFGADWTPPSVPGLRLGVSYYDIAYSDRILVPQFTPASLSDPTFLGIVNRSLTAAQQAALCASTTFGGNATGLPGGCTSVPVTILIDARTRNVAKLNTNGIDLSASYGFALGPGHAELGTDATYVFRYLFDVPAGQRDYVNTAGNVPHLKVRSSAGWSIGGFNATLFMDYISKSHDNRVAPSVPIKSYASFDLNLGYAFADTGLLGHTRLNLNVQNLFDRQPPFVDNTLYGYDPQNYDLRGRFIRLSLTKGW
ncbi:TonB-dependent receptor [Sphingomonas sp.]|uniref:TonB-dependent receptor n=1 Tax=Sphingomonas sp. TaxID=28214 RepID=UPI001B06D5A7|nr:TonB-dependent receptor [Sphingomonas sp.]MBO9713302.1 TonB-dependent receptor [Sphingomonas sp.]